jgi:two-component system KDP operon response regulator KdpE
LDKEPAILIIEDEPQIRRFLKASLPAEGYHLLEAGTGQEGITMIANLSPAVVLLDLGLPDLDGIDVTRRIREWSQVPIIVLSARGDEVDKIEALDAGANDYITKPFSIGELLARIRVVMRPQLKPEAGQSEPEFTFGAVRIDFASRQVFRDGVEIHLTPIEYKLLGFLVRHRGKVITHKQLLTEVWGQGYARQTQYLRVFMGNLRHKLERDPAKPKHLTTDPGVGYRFRE